jgi:hypothetical protein
MFSANINEPVRTPYGWLQIWLSKDGYYKSIGYMGSRWKIVDKTGDIMVVGGERDFLLLGGTGKCSIRFFVNKEIWEKNRRRYHSPHGNNSSADITFTRNRVTYGKKPLRPVCPGEPIELELIVEGGADMNKYFCRWIFFDTRKIKSRTEEADFRFRKVADFQNWKMWDYLERWRMLLIACQSKNSG